LPHKRSTNPPRTPVAALQGTLLTTDFGVSGKGAQELMIDLYSIAKTHGAACSTLT
jgi:hypothetical protein